MVPRSLLMFGVMFASLLAISPAFADDDDVRFSLSGTVWLDANVDGVRQSFEPAVPRALVILWRGNKPYGDQKDTDDGGKYRFDWPTEGWSDDERHIDMLVLYKRPWDDYVDEYPGSTFSYSHWGCAYLHVPAGESERTVDIRLVRGREADKVRYTPPKNWPVEEGHFFKEMASPNGCDSGYSVTNADGIPFWDTWQRLGLENVGYPLSHRFEWRGYVTQVFQKAVFQWRPGRGVFFVDIFDELHAAGMDDLPDQRWLKLPSRLDTTVFDAGKSRKEMERDRLALLDGNEAIKERYYAVPDPLLQYGLPTSQVQDYHNASAIRTEKGVIVLWKERTIFPRPGRVGLVDQAHGWDVYRHDLYPEEADEDLPFAKKGEVTIANGGELAGWGLFPEDVQGAFTPQPTPAWQVRTVDEEEYLVAVSGAVWVDENEDGIRQPSDPVLPGEEVSIHVSSRHYSRLAGTVTADEQGLYRYPETFAGGDFTLVTHNEDPEYYGCARFYVPAGATELTVNLRVVRNVRFRLPPENWPVAEGHFFKETSPAYPHCDMGFSVTNADGITFWDTWQRLGLQNVGYPISHRYEWEGLVTQAFQKAVFQWQPGRGVVLVDIFDELHEAGMDGRLHSRWVIPFPFDASFDSGKSRVEIQRDRLALLDANAAIKERYYAADEPLLQYGLPTSRVEDYGNVVAIRTQSAVLQQWKEDSPWAKTGEVAIANGGEIAERLGWIPMDALIPQHVDVIGQGGR